MPEKTTRLMILTGASRGLGLAIARQALQEGAQLLTLARSHSPQLQELAGCTTGRLEQWQVDLAHAAPVAERLRQWLGNCAPSAFHEAVLINNAGVIPEIAAFSELRATDTSHAIAVNLLAPMLLSQAFLAATEAWPLPRKLLNISSGLGRRPMASQACYCTAKAGLDQFSQCLALEEARKPHGASVCSLAPGVIDSDMQQHLRSADAARFPDLARFEQLHQQARLTSPDAAAAQVLAWLERADFGEQVVPDVRQP